MNSSGYSSLSYLLRVPAKEMKIDRSFISRVSDNPSLTTIVGSTIELGHRLGMKVVAEGVEDSDDYALLRELGCDSAQGYYMSPPLPPEAFTAWMQGRLPERLSRAEPAFASAAADTGSLRAVNQTSLRLADIPGLSQWVRCPAILFAVELGFDLRLRRWRWHAAGGQKQQGPPQVAGAG